MAIPRVPRRGRPRAWHHDYLHLRRILRDLEERIPAAVAGGGLRRVLDVGSGDTPYLHLFGDRLEAYVRVDLAAESDPSVVARAEALPFASDSFDAVLSTQVLPLVGDPKAMGGEVARVLRQGGIAWISGPGAYPFDTDRAENRFGELELPALFPGLAVREVVREGGMLALPSVVLNVSIREAVRSAERRLGAAGRLLRGPAATVFIAANVLGRLLETASGSGPLSSFLGHLDARLPMNWLVVLEKPR